MFPKDRQPLQIEGLHPVVRTVARTIADFDMLQPAEAVLVAVSGGADSVALLHILKILAPAYSIRLGIAHLNHGLRGADADRDARFVAALADESNLRCHIETVDVQRYRLRRKLSLEEAARQVRYDFYAATAARHGYAKIALGHHADDNAESVLMFLFRGSGPTGLSGIQPVRNGKIIRPLIRLTRRQTREYLDEKGIPHVSDSSNRDHRFLRNRIRNELIPQLKADYNPAIIRSLNRLADIFRKENEWLEPVIAPIFEQIVTGTGRDRLAVSLESFGEFPEAVQRRLVRKAIAAVKGDLRRISFSHIDAVNRLAVSGPMRGALDLPDGIRVDRQDRTLLFIKGAYPHRAGPGGKLIAEAPQFRYTVANPFRQPLQLEVPEIGLQMHFSVLTIQKPLDFQQGGQNEAFFDMEKLTFPLILRNVQPGDRFKPLGMSSGSQKVKKYFIDHKVPHKQRSRHPVLLSGDQIIWVVGRRISETCKVGISTRRVLKAAVYLA